MNIIVNVIIKQENKILMVQENCGNVKGMWNFPAGRLDEGENIFDGAIREAKEETGFDVKLTGIVNIQNVVYDDRHVIHVCFSAEVVGGSIAFDPAEISDVKYIDINELLSMSDSVLRGGDTRKETIKKVQNENILPLSIITNYNYK